jgi:LPS export ABC transporter permease LptG/LPS export ABC transporter permease LptF
LWYKPRIIDSYIIKEFVPHFIISIVILTFTLILRHLLRVVENVITKGVSLELTLKLLAYYLPSIIVLTIPMSLLVGIIIAFGRLSSDSEVTALKAGGYSITKVLTPVYLIAIVCYLISAIVFLEVLPRANYKALEILYQIARSKADALIEPRLFIDEFPGLIIYINEKLPNENKMDGVFLASVSNPNKTVIILAKNGKFIPDPNGRNPIIHLENGIMSEISDDSSTEKALNRFYQQDFRLPFEDTNSKPKIKVYKGEREQNFDELLDHVYILKNRLFQSERAFNIARKEKSPNNIRLVNATQNLDIVKKSYNIAILELHKKFAFPFACLIFPLIAVPFGLKNKKGSKFTGFAYSLLFFVFYYILMTFGKNMGEEGKLNPALAMWLSNIITGVIGLIFLYIEVREKSFAFSEKIGLIWIKVSRSKIINSILTRFKNQKQEKSIVGQVFSGVFRFPGTGYTRVLDHYIIKEFVFIAVFVLISVLAIFDIVEIFEKIDDIFENKSSILYLFKYLYYEQPQILGYIIPVAILITTLLTIAIMTKNNEITAMKAAGISIFRIIRPLIIIGLVASALNFFLHEDVIPEANRQTKKIWEIDVNKNVPKGLSTQNQIWYRAEGNKIFNIKLMIGDVNTMFGVTIFEFDKQFAIQQIFVADSAKWNEKGFWDMRKVRIRKFLADGNIDIKEYNSMTYKTVETPADFMKEDQVPEEMNISELKKYIVKLEQAGYSTNEQKTKLHNKLAVPLTSLIMVLIAIPFALKVGKSGAMAGIGVSIAIGISYFVIHAGFLAIGYSGRIPPLMAAWTANILFLCIALYMLTKVET